jgi:antitoxin FitA
MAQLLVRDVPDEIASALKKRAAKNGRSAEAEHRAILEASLKPAGEDFWEGAAKLREETRGRKLTDSTELLRQIRDEE